MPSPPDPAAEAPHPVVRTRGLTKQFRGRPAVDTLDLEVPRGAVFGFLGPNGSGKTTTIRMLLGLVRPTAGAVEVLGRELPGGITEVLPRVGSLVEGPAFHPYLNARANLRRLDAADLTADPATTGDRVETALDRVGLTDVAHKRFRAFSLGMKQRLAIAAALLQPRELLILDEPTNGLDPQGTREIRQLVAELRGDGATMIISSHLLSEIEQICTHVGVMAKGRLLTSGTLETIRAGAAPRFRLTTPDTRAATTVLTGLEATDLRTEGDTVTGTPATDMASEDLVAALVGADIRVRGFELESRLEEEFIKLTGAGFDVS